MLRWIDSAFLPPVTKSLRAYAWHVKSVLNIVSNIF